MVQRHTLSNIHLYVSYTLHWYNFCSPFASQVALKISNLSYVLKGKEIFVHTLAKGPTATGSGHCPLALAWSTGSEPSAYTLYLGYKKGSTEFVPICSPFPFLLFHGKNNRIVGRDPGSISRDNQRPQRAQNLLVLSNISCN